MGTAFGRTNNVVRNRPKSKSTVAGTVLILAKIVLRYSQKIIQKDTKTQGHKYKTNTKIQKDSTVLILAQIVRRWNILG